MNRNSKKHENILIAVILICTCANLIFNVLLVKNALSCRKMLREAETLAQRAGAVKENAPEDTDETVQREETEERESLAEETEATEAEATESEELPPSDGSETKSLIFLEKPRLWERNGLSVR